MDSTGSASKSSFSSFRDWTGDRSVVAVGTNAGSNALPFQNWRRFKEAFAPEIVARAVATNDRKIAMILDPFGGSGTTALASQFLQIHPVSIEVNPYLADLIEAKLTEYCADEVVAALRVVEFARPTSTASSTNSFLTSTPRTFVEPGVNDRWIFNFDIAQEIASIVVGIEAIGNPAIRRLFKVLLGAVAVDVSNIVVSGKGRRYRRGWRERSVTPLDLRRNFLSAVGQAIRDVVRYSGQRYSSYTLLRGDARKLVDEIPLCDIAIYSPPYPNSFDYTDVYNVELWILGYLETPEDNYQLRQSTLSSHVQLQRSYAACPSGSATLDHTMMALGNVRETLWNRQIPAMVGAYFAEIISIIERVFLKLPESGKQWIIVGDSRYGGVNIPVGEIIVELAKSRNIASEIREPFRSMRAAPQQGGQLELSETLIVLNR